MDACAFEQKSETNRHLVNEDGSEIARRKCRPPAWKNDDRETACQQTSDEGPRAGQDLWRVADQALSSSHGSESAVGKGARAHARPVEAPCEAAIGGDPNQSSNCTLTDPIVHALVRHRRHAREELVEISSLKEASTQYNSGNATRVGDIGERIGVKQDKICHLACFNSTD